MSQSACGDQGKKQLTLYSTVKGLKEMTEGAWKNKLIITSFTI